MDVLQVFRIPRILFKTNNPYSEQTIQLQKHISQVKHIQLT